MDASSIHESDTDGGLALKSSDLIRNEGVAVRPFAGSRQLQESMEKNVKLEVETGQGKFDLTSSDTLAIPPSEMRVAGITLKVLDLDEIFKRVDPMVMSREDVDLYVVAIDGPTSPLRSSEVLYKAALSDFESAIPINRRGSQSDSRVLSNVHGRYSIELALVHNKELATKSALKPRKKGALLAKIQFSLKPTGINDQPKPKPMDKELKESLGLPSSSWFYLKTSPSLLEAPSFDEAFDFYVDRDLLDALKVAKPSAQGALEGLLVATLVQGLCFEVATLGSEAESLEEAELEDSAVVKMMKKRLGVKNFAELLDELTESPSKAATKMLAVNSLVKSFMGSLEEVSDE